MFIREAEDSPVVTLFDRYVFGSAPVSHPGFCAARVKSESGDSSICIKEESKSVWLCLFLSLFDGGLRANVCRKCKWPKAMCSS